VGAVRERVGRRRFRGRVSNGGNCGGVRTRRERHSVLNWVIRENDRHRGCVSETALRSKTGLAAAGENDAAIERFRSTFAPARETARPNATRHTESRHSACHCHGDEDAGVGETIGSRERSAVSVASTDGSLDPYGETASRVIPVASGSHRIRNRGVRGSGPRGVTGEADSKIARPRRRR